MKKNYPSFSEEKFENFKKSIKVEKTDPETLEGKQKKEFLNGAEIAYETIITAFAKGDRKEV